MLSLIWFLRCMSEFWCQSLSNWASLDPAAGRSGWWEESGIFGTWVTFQHIHSLHALSLVVFFLLVSFHPPPRGRKERKRNNCMHGLPRGWTDQKHCSQTPISLVSTRRGTVRIQNTDSRPKPRNAPLSAPCQLPVCYAKVPLVVNHAAACRGS